MIARQEGEQTKPIKVIEYDTSKREVPLVFEAQTKDLFWKQFGHSTVLSEFARNLARAYLPGYSDIAENMYPLDKDLEYYFFRTIIQHTASQLTQVLHAASGNVEGKRIVDLGCGSTNSGELSDLDLFHPWLCRTLVELRAYPIGVDIGKLEGEQFEAHGETNLLLSNALDFIPDGSVDIVHSRALFTSPRLYDEFKEAGISALVDYDEYLMKVLQPQITRILKPDGTFVFSKGL